MARKEPSELVPAAEIRGLASGSRVGETVLNIFKATLATAPFCGGIVSLISDYVPSVRFKRLEEFAKSVAEDLKNFQDRVDHNYIKSEDFAFMFERCFRGAAEHPQEEKLQAFRGILVNSLICDNIVEHEKEYFLNLVNTLSALHLRILHFLFDPEGYVSAANISPQDIRGGFRQFMPVVIPGVDCDVIESAFGDLHRFGLVSTDKSVFGTMTAAQGIQLAKNRVSDLGSRFITFCISGAT